MANISPINKKTGRFLPVDPIKRFWNKVEKTKNCWNWKGHILTSGYGQIGLRDNKHQSTHRFSYELHYGSIPKGMCVCHKCDNKKCVKPNHLWLGTNAQNTTDRQNKKRGIKGETHPNHKLTENQVKMIKQLNKCGKSNIELALEFGVFKAAISKIVTGRTWRHLND